MMDESKREIGNSFVLMNPCFIDSKRKCGLDFQVVGGNFTVGSKCLNDILIGLLNQQDFLAAVSKLGTFLTSPAALL